MADFMTFVVCPVRTGCAIIPLGRASAQAVIILAGPILQEVSMIIVAKLAP